MISCHENYCSEWKRVLGEMIGGGVLGEMIGGGVLGEMIGGGS